MPVYEYQCQSCKLQFEKIQKFSDPPLSKCETCGGILKKILSAPALVFKGSGWYITDYSRKPREKEGSTGVGEKPSGEKGKEASPSAPASAPPPVSPKENPK